MGNVLCDFNNFEHMGNLFGRVLLDPLVAVVQAVADKLSVANTLLLTVVDVAAEDVADMVFQGQFPILSAA